MATTRRCHAGYTREKWPCCGREPDGQRQKGTICAECAALIADGKIAREKLREVPRDVVHWTEVNYGFPGYCGDWEFRSPSDAHERLKRALFALANAVSVPAPSDTPRHAPTYRMVDRSWGGRGKERQHDAWPRLLSVEARGDSRSWDRLVLIDPTVRQALEEFDLAVRAALADVYAEGKARGRSVLYGLATGETSMADFDDALMTRAEREDRRRSGR